MSDVKLTYYADTGGNDAWEAECQKCFRRSGYRYEREAREWRCPGLYCQDIRDSASEVKTPWRVEVERRMAFVAETARRLRRAANSHARSEST